MAETHDQWRARMMRETEGMTRPGDILEHLAKDAQHHPVPAPPEPEPEPPSTPLSRILSQLADLVDGAPSHESWVIWGLRDGLRGIDLDEPTRDEVGARAIAAWQKGSDLAQEFAQVRRLLTEADLDDINTVLRRGEDGRLTVDVAHCVHCGVVVLGPEANGARTDECPNPECDGELYPVSKLVALGDGVQPTNLKGG